MTEATDTARTTSLTPRAVDDGAREALAQDDRDEFCHALGLHLADAMEGMGVEDADLSDGRVLADVVYCLGYQLPPADQSDTTAERQVAAVREVCADPDDTQWWPVVPYMDPHDEDEVVETQVVSVDRILAALDTEPCP